MDLSIDVVTGWDLVDVRSCVVPLQISSQETKYLTGSEPLVYSSEQRFAKMLCMLELPKVLKPQKTCDILHYQQLAAMILYTYLHNIRAG